MLRAAYEVSVLNMGAMLPEGVYHWTAQHPEWDGPPVSAYAIDDGRTLLLIDPLDVPEEVRARYDLSSLTHVVHAAAPCPKQVKQLVEGVVGPGGVGLSWENADRAGRDLLLGLRAR